MPFWTDVAGFCFAALVAPLILLHLWAFINPDGKISKRLHPPNTSPEEMTTIHQHIRALERIALQGPPVPPAQPDPFEDVELVTTVRRRRRRADNTIGGPQEPGL
jgi:hypothetical protein